MASFEFSPTVKAQLDAFGFDATRFATERALLAQHGYTSALAREKGSVRPLESEHLVDVGAKVAERRALGEAALRAGSVALVLLNGGMATRFGGVAKGAAVALRGRSFLELRLGQARDLSRSVGAQLAVVLMNSFATDTATRTHLEEKRFFELENSALMSCVQGVSLRLSERGDVVCDAQGEPSLYAPGHGDLPWALESSGVAAKLRARGVETLFVSNVDNLGCTLDPAILGAHLEAKNPISVECCTRTAADSGGAPVYVDDTPQLLEGFRLPQGFDESSLSAFNTNTFYFSWSALRAESFARLAFYPVAKVVDGRSVVQFERILGELTRFSPTTYLRVPRDAETGRFLPVKAPEDLARLEATLAARYRSP